MSAIADGASEPFKPSFEQVAAEPRRLAVAPLAGVEGGAFDRGQAALAKLG